MRHLLLTASLMFVASPVFAEVSAMPGAGDVPVDFKPPSCDITVSFGSAGAGTDSDTGMSMRAYLDGATAQMHYSEESWGHEGEYKYCITISNPDNARQIYRELKSLLPIQNSNQPPVMIKARHMNAQQVAPISDPVPPLPDDR